MHFYVKHLKICSENWQFLLSETALQKHKRVGAVFLLHPTEYMVGASLFLPLAKTTIIDYLELCKEET